MDRGITPGGFTMWRQRATSKVCVFTHERARALKRDAGKTARFLLERDEPRDFDLLGFWIRHMLACFFIFEIAQPSTRPRSSIHWQFAFLTLFLLLKCFCLWIAISGHCVFFLCSMQKVSIKKSFHWILLFVQSSVYFFTYTRPKAYWAIYITSFHFNSHLLLCCIGNDSSGKLL